MKAETAAPPSLLIDARGVAAMLGIKASTWRSRVFRGQAPLPLARSGKMSYWRRRDAEHFAEHGAWPEGMQFLAARSDLTPG